MSNQPQIEIDASKLTKEQLVDMVLHMQHREVAVTTINNELIFRLNGKVSEGINAIVNEWSRVMIGMDEASTREKSKIIAGCELPPVAH